MSAWFEENDVPAFLASALCPEPYQPYTALVCDPPSTRQRKVPHSRHYRGLRKCGVAFCHGVL